MNSVEAKKGFKTFVVLATTTLVMAGSYKYFPIGYQYITKARQSAKIDNLQILNITQSSITVTWETDMASVGHVVYGESPTELDQLEVEPSKRKQHEVSLTNLKPQQTYYYKIGVDDAPVGKIPYQFTTLGY